MPSSKPRITVLLDESQYAVITELAALRGVSRGSVLRELYEASEDTLRRVISVLRAAKSAEGTYLDTIKQDMKEADDQIRPLIEQVIGLFGIHVDDIEKKLQ